VLRNNYLAENLEGTGIGLFRLRPNAQFKNNKIDKKLNAAG
jgi:hypothetical protein